MKEFRKYVVVEDHKDDMYYSFFDTLEEANREAYCMCDDVHYEGVDIYVEVIDESSFGTFEIECYEEDNPESDWREDPEFWGCYTLGDGAIPTDEPLFNSATYYDLKAKYAEVKDILNDMEDFDGMSDSEIDEYFDRPSRKECERLYNDCKEESLEIGLNEIDPYFFDTDDTLKQFKASFERYAK